MRNQSLPNKAVAFIIAIVATCTCSVYAQSPVANFSATSTAGCSPLVVNFQNLSTGSATSWHWDFGNGNTSAVQNPTASYFTPGTYTVSLTATNTSGSNTISKVAYINVYEPPTVNFSASSTEGCFPLPVQFTDMSTAGVGNTNVSWNWNFGNGQTSTERNPFVSYTNSGFYSVTLKVTNDKGCTRTITKTNYINVSTGVDAAFGNTQPLECNAPSSISFTNNSTGPGVLSYQWLFGDGNSSNAKNPVYIYNSNGSYTVTLIVTSSSGCIDTVRSSSPMIIGGARASFKTVTKLCVNETVDFTVTSTPTPISVAWDFGDGGTSTQINASHSYATSGSYTVKLITRFSNCIDSTTSVIVVNEKPVAAFNSPDTVNCQKTFTSHFNDQSTGAVSWQWNFGDGATSAEQNPAHTYSNYGDYTVSLTITNEFGCTNTIVRSNYIRSKKPVISTSSLPAKGCIPFTIKPVAIVDAFDTVVSYLWNFGDGSTSTDAMPEHIYTVQGTYTVMLIITTATGCTDTLIIPEAVKAGTKPATNFSASPLIQCAYQPVFFTDLTVAPVDEWRWLFGDGSVSAEQNPAHAYGFPGVYTVSLIATNNGCSDTLRKPNYIRVLPPVARFEAIANCALRTEFQFVDNSVGPVTWQWDFGDGSPIVTSQNPVHTFPALGEYNVTLTVTNGSCSHSLTKKVYALDADPLIASDKATVCKPGLVNFTATNIVPAYIQTYSWDFGDNIRQETTSADISHTYTASGTYTVRLITRDLNGCRDTVVRSNYIRVNGPTADFTANNTSGCIGFTTTFNDHSTSDGINNIVNWQWDFGDGTIQDFSSAPFQHTYNLQGIFSVTLKVTDATGCSHSYTMQNLVRATRPVASFASPDTLSCPASAVNFQNTSTVMFPIANSYWEFGDGNSSTTAGAAAVAHSYNTTGSYSIKLRITDNYGCSDSLQKNLYINVGVPQAAMAISDSFSSCSPMKVEFANLSSYYASSSWDFGGSGTTILNSPVHFFPSPSVYNVKLVVTSPGGCKDTAYKTITVYDTAGIVLQYLDIADCKPQSASFTTASPGPMVNYIWDFGDGNIKTTATPNADHVYNTFGNFLPRLIMEDASGCQIPVTGRDTLQILGVKAKFGSDKKFLCDRGVINFIDSTTFSDPIHQYNWTFGDGATSNLQAPSHQYNSPGYYDVSLVVETQKGCKDTARMLNAIKIVQSPVIDIAGDTSVCLNGSLFHSGVFLQSDTSVVEWVWRFPNGNNSSEQVPGAQKYTTAGKYTVNAIATNSSGCKDTATRNVIIYSLPIITLPQTMTVQNGFPVPMSATYSSGVVNWKWAFSDGLSCTDCPVPMTGPKFNTTYNVAVTDSNGCKNTGSIKVIVTCGNSNLFIPNTFSPNGDGSNDVFYPRGRGLNRMKSLRIFNRWGEMVFEKRDFVVNDPSAGWNGTFKGAKPHADVYIYQAEVFCDNGEIILLDGNIALIL